MDTGLHGNLKAIGNNGVLSGHNPLRDVKSVKRLEAGEVALHPDLVACVAFALQATEIEATLLFEVAGYSGWAAMIRKKRGGAADRGAAIRAWVERDLNRLSYNEVLHVLELQMEAELKEGRQP